jgi:hypothetical protein
MAASYSLMNRQEPGMVEDMTFLLRKAFFTVKNRLLCLHGSRSAKHEKSRRERITDAGWEMRGIMPCGISDRSERS